MPGSQDHDRIVALEATLENLKERVTAGAADPKDHDLIVSLKEQVEFQNRAIAELKAGLDAQKPYVRKVVSVGFSGLSLVALILWGFEMKSIQSKVDKASTSLAVLDATKLATNSAVIASNAAVRADSDARRASNVLSEISSHQLEENEFVFNRDDKNKYMGCDIRYDDRKDNNRPYKIMYATRSVTFKNSFRSPPKVTISVYGADQPGSYYKIEIDPKKISTTNFTITLIQDERKGYLASMVGHWIAIEWPPLPH